ncbi:MAG: molybdate ABC transporter substrate-binding protein [Gemmatimonadota bacterium]
MLRSSWRFGIVLGLGCLACAPESDDVEEIHVFAASSLTDALQSLASEFEQEEEGLEVVLSFAGSQTLRVQIEQGARADLFASANPDHIDALVADELVSDVQAFAFNSLAVVVPLARSNAPETFEGLVDAERIVVGHPNAPIGQYTLELLSNLERRHGRDFVERVRSSIVSEETNVRLVRAKVEVGEADAGIVYRSDAVSSSRVRAIPIPVESNVRAEYSFARLRDAPASDVATAFVAFVLSERGQRVLELQGFAAVRP